MDNPHKIHIILGKKGMRQPSKIAQGKTAQENYNPAHYKVIRIQFIMK